MGLVKLRKFACLLRKLAMIDDVYIKLAVVLLQAMQENEYLLISKRNADCDKLYGDKMTLGCHTFINVFSIRCIIIIYIRINALILHTIMICRFEASEMRKFTLYDSIKNVSTLFKYIYIYIYVCVCIWRLILVNEVTMQYTNHINQFSYWFKKSFGPGTWAFCLPLSQRRISNILHLSCHYMGAFLSIT